MFSIKIIKDVELKSLFFYDNFLKFVDIKLFILLKFIVNNGLDLEIYFRFLYVWERYFNNLKYVLLFVMKWLISRVML